MRCMGETHDEGENGHPFFWCTYTAWLTKQTSARQKHLHGGNTSRACTRHYDCHVLRENKGKVTAGNVKKEYDPLPVGKLCVGKDVHQEELK